MNEVYSRVLRERNELNTTLGAWEDSFGTTQLSHAIARLERAESLLHDIAKSSGWLRTDETRQLWERLEAWEKNNTPCP